MGKIVRSTKAKADLLHIWEHIAEDNPRAATKFLRRLNRVIHEISDSPKMGRSRSSDLHYPGLRSHSVGNYVIFYHLPEDESGGVVIVRVANGARDIETLLSE